MSRTYLGMQVVGRWWAGGGYDAQEAEDPRCRHGGRHGPAQLARQTTHQARHPPAATPGEQTHPLGG
eukprot:7099818-Pyramimonas_sp.AAC.1